VTRRRLFTFLFFLLPILYYLSIPNSVGDLAIWIAHGRYFLEHQSLLRHDVFSVLPTSALTYPAGLSVFYGLIDRLGGLVAVGLLHKICLLFFLGVIYFSSIKDLADPWRPRNFAIIGVSLYGSANFCIDRPAEVAILPFIASFLILDKNRPLRAIERWALVGLAFVWVNIHGSWVLLPAMFAWRTCFGARFRTGSPRALGKEILTAAGIFFASLLNPFFLQIYPYTLQTAMISRARGIDEWATTGFGAYFPQGLFFFGLVAAVVAMMMMTSARRRDTLFDSPFFILLLLGFTAIRNTSWPFLALIPFCHRAGWLQTGPNPIPVDRPSTAAAEFLPEAREFWSEARKRRALKPEHPLRAVRISKLFADEATAQKSTRMREKSRGGGTSTPATRAQPGLRTA
jgi:hypothetical protein